MQLIKDLASLIQLSKINVLDGREDRETQLFRMTAENSQSKDELVHYFFPESAYRLRNFNRLKRSLRDRLINSLFSYEPLKKKYRDIYFSTAKQALASELLWNKGKSNTAAILAKEALETALRYHFTSTTFSLSRLLADHYAGLSPQPALFKRYNTIFQEARFRLKWEKTAEEYYYNLALQLRGAKSINPALIQQAVSYIEELEPIEPVSWEFVHHRLSIYLIWCKTQNNGTGIITACKEALAYFEALNFQLPNRPFRSLSLNLIPAYFQSGDYAQVQAAIQRVKSLLPPSGYNWVAIHQYEAIAAFHIHDLALAQSAIQEIKRSKLAKSIQEEIRIYETYRSFLAGDPIRMSTFLNDTPTFSMDKKGMNINRLILQILILLSKNDRSSIIDRAEALEKYAYRYLKKDETTRRSQIFMRLLFLTVRHSFDWPTIQKQTAKTYAQLLATPRHLSTIDIEVVPYEVLWGRVGEVLG